MADSKNSRILPSVTRRTLLSGAIVTAQGLIAKPPMGTASQLPTRPCLDDPAVDTGQKWEAAHTRYADLVHIAPSEIKISLNEDVSFVSTSEEIDRCLGGDPEWGKAHRRAMADLAALSGAWDVADDHIGYSQVAEAKSKACEQRSALAESVLTSSARLVAGAAAKLRCFIEMNTPILPWVKHVRPALRSIIEEPSFPDLRSILVDLNQLGEAGDV